MSKIIMPIVVILILFTACNLSSNKNNKAMQQKISKDFGEKYAAAWSGQNAAAHANFFASNGIQIVNNGTPAVGHEAIAKVAQGFMTAFPDMLVVCDSLPATSKGVEFHWTLTGMNTGPEGTGKKVHISGVEILQFNSDGFITESNGSFDEVEYNKQLKEGVEY